MSVDPVGPDLSLDFYAIQCGFWVPGEGLGQPRVLEDGSRGLPIQYFHKWDSCAGY